MDNIDLVKMAIDAKEKAFVPYSHYKVGAALLTDDGKVFKGCNVECSSYGMTVCAERVALVKAVSEGYTNFSKIAVVGGKEDELIYTTPCGACRQFLNDFGQDIDVILGYKENNVLLTKEYKLSDLLPESFNL